MVRVDRVVQVVMRFRLLGAKDIQSVTATVHSRLPLSSCSCNIAEAAGRLRLRDELGGSRDGHLAPSPPSGPSKRIAMPSVSLLGMIQR